MVVKVLFVVATMASDNTFFDGTELVRAFIKRKEVSEC